MDKPRAKLYYPCDSFICFFSPVAPVSCAPLGSESFLSQEFSLIFKRLKLFSHQDKNFRRSLLPICVRVPLFSTAFSRCLLSVGLSPPFASHLFSNNHAWSVSVKNKRSIQMFSLFVENSSTSRAADTHNCHRCLQDCEQLDLQLIGLTLTGPALTLKSNSSRGFKVQRWWHRHQT